MKISPGMRLAALMAIIVLIHAFAIVQARMALSASYPDFTGLRSTSDLFAGCGRFSTSSNRQAFPDGERYYRAGAQLYRESELRRRRAADERASPPRCPTRTGIVSVLLDPVLLPLLGRPWSVGR